jgi:hypothetical protein
VADEVWIATAFLHKENPAKADFGIEEILNRAASAAPAGPQRPGVYVHVVQHCVANRPANPGKYRMLIETGSGRRRLFRKGDAYHPSREGGKIHPNADEIPAEYEELLQWYEEWSSAAGGAAAERDPLLSLSGSGSRLWSDEHADAYVSRLREGWE